MNSKRAFRRTQAENLQREDDMADIEKSKTSLGFFVVVQTNK